jgi:hypothetical protein
LEILHRKIRPPPTSLLDPPLSLSWRTFYREHWTKISTSHFLGDPSPLLLTNATTKPPLRPSKAPQHPSQQPPPGPPLSPSWGTFYREGLLRKLSRFTGVPRLMPKLMRAMHDSHSELATLHDSLLYRKLRTLFACMTLTGIFFVRHQRTPRGAK